jgi:hypothetical protein
VLLGFVRAHAPGMVPDPIGMAMLDETEEMLLVALGADGLGRLKARGAALTTREAIELVLPRSRSDVLASERGSHTGIGDAKSSGGCHQGMVEPPLGRITMPVTNFAAGDAR